MYAIYPKAFLLSVTAAFLFLHSPLLLANDIVATVNPLPPPVVSTFPAATPPADLPAGEDADTTTSTSVTASYSFAFSGATYTVTSVAATVSGTTKIRLPDDADKTLKDHEDGHAKLDRNEYEQNAQRKAEVAFNGFIGQTFVAVGATEAERTANAKAHFDAETARRSLAAESGMRAQGETLSDKYDKLTAHGTSPTIDTDTGVTLAMIERDNAKPAGSGNSVPYPYGGILDPALVSFDPNTGLVTFSGDRLIDFALNPADTILGRGTIQIDPLIYIGQQDDGSLLLSDTNFRIIDVVTGNLLMDAFLFEVAYMPSSISGFTGMIESYLDIPPDFAGGIDNFIGSDFLSSIGAVRDGGQTSFHFFVGEDPFRKTDLPSPPVGPVKGLLVIGTDLPEPGSGLLVLAGLLGLLAKRKRRAGFAVPNAGIGRDGSSRIALVPCGTASDRQASTDYRAASWRRSARVSGPSTGSLENSSSAASQ